MMATCWFKWSGGRYPTLVPQVLTLGKKFYHHFLTLTSCTGEVYSYRLTVLGCWKSPLHQSLWESDIGSDLMDLMAMKIKIPKKKKAKKHDCHRYLATTFARLVILDSINVDGLGFLDVDGSFLQKFLVHLFFLLSLGHLYKIYHGQRQFINNQQQDFHPPSQWLLAYHYGQPPSTLGLTHCRQSDIYVSLNSFYAWRWPDTYVSRNFRFFLRCKGAKRLKRNNHG